MFTGSKLKRLYRGNRIVFPSVLFVLFVFAFSVVLKPPILLIPSQPIEITPLHTSGTKIYNDKNQEVRLALASVSYGGGEGFGLQDIKRIKAMGFDGFRLMIYWSRLQPVNKDSVNLDFFTNATYPLGASFDDVVSWAVQEKVFLIVTLSWTYYWQPPAWAFPDLTANQSTEQYAGLFSGSYVDAREGYVNTFRFIAERYKDIPNIIFENTNEPTLPLGHESLAGEHYAQFNTEIVDAIQSVETVDHLFLIQCVQSGPTVWEEILPTVDVNRTNVVWSYHYFAPYLGYRPTDPAYIREAFTWEGTDYPRGWNTQENYITWRLVRLRNIIHGWGKPWMNTGFGKNTAEVYVTQWMSHVLEVSSKLGFCGWSIEGYDRIPDLLHGWDIADSATWAIYQPILAPYM